MRIGPQMLCFDLRLLVFVGRRLGSLIGDQVRYVCIASTCGLHNDHARGQRRRLYLLACWHFLRSHLCQSLLLMGLWMLLARVDC